jgi:DNA-binding PadR family transcriptional regulator
MYHMPINLRLGDPMSLKHVILVVLKKGSASGYEINQTFEGPLGFFWDTSHQRVYRALAAMAKEGWVSYIKQQQNGKPDKKIYDITPPGEQALMQWLCTNQTPPPVNEAILVKFFAGSLCPTPALIEQVQTHRRVHQANLARYEAIEQEFFLEPEPVSEDTLRLHLTLRRGVLMEKARLDWCEEALTCLEQGRPDNIR